jgi:hypothetical protein
LPPVLGRRKRRDGKVAGDEPPDAPDDATLAPLADEINGLMLAALADDFRGDVPSVDYDVGPEGTDLELAQALVAWGLFLLIELALNPPLQDESRAEKLLLLEAADRSPARGLQAARFLAHALVDHRLLDREVAIELSDRLDFSPASPRPIQYRAQRALRSEMPIGEAERRVLRQAEQSVRAVRDLDPEVDVQGAFLFRLNEFQLTASVHAIMLLLLDEFELSQTARDNSGYSNLPGLLNMIEVWKPSEDRVWEVLLAAEGA